MAQGRELKEIMKEWLKQSTRGTRPGRACGQKGRAGNWRKGGRNKGRNVWPRSGPQGVRVQSCRPSSPVLRSVRGESSHLADTETEAQRACHLPKVTQLHQRQNGGWSAVLLCRTSSHSVFIFQVHFSTVD